ncbi:hypothetical protein [Amycolatopsis sp. lyj-23]
MTAVPVVMSEYPPEPPHELSPYPLLNNVNVPRRSNVSPELPPGALGEPE